MRDKVIVWVMLGFFALATVAGITHLFGQTGTCLPYNGLDRAAKSMGSVLVYESDADPEGRSLSVYENPENKEALIFIKSVDKNVACAVFKTYNLRKVQ